MRLDKYLKVSRLIKRRTIANEACDAGRVLVNGKAARASYDVKAGDVIEIVFGEKTVGGGSRGRGDREKRRGIGSFPLYRMTGTTREKEREGENFVKIGANC